MADNLQCSKILIVPFFSSIFHVFYHVQRMSGLDLIKIIKKKTLILLPLLMLKSELTRSHFTTEQSNHYATRQSCYTKSHEVANSQSVK